MYWNHRVIVTFEDSLEPMYCVHEVFYKDDGSIEGWTASPIRVVADDFPGLKQLFGRFKIAAGKPILVEKKVGRKSTLVEYKPEDFGK